MRSGAVVASAAFLVFTRVFGMSVVLPGFRDHAATLTPSATWAGVAMGGYALTLALMQLPMGLLSDRYGRRPILVLGSVLFVAGSMWAAVAGSIEALIAARLVQGLGAVSSAAMAMVGETVPPQRRTFAMAMVGIPAGGGFMLGLLAAPVLEPLVGFRGLFWLVAAAGAAAALPLLRLRPGAVHESLGHVGRVDARTMALAACGFTANFALLAVMFHLPLQGPDLVPLLSVAVVAMLVASRATDRAGATWGPIAVLVPLLAASAAAFVLGGGAWTLAAGAVFFSVHATLSALLPSQVSRTAGRSGGKGHGIQNLVAYPGSFLGATTAGAATAAGHPMVAYIVLGTLGAVVALGLAWAWRRPTGLPEGSPAEP